MKQKQHTVGTISNIYLQNRRNRSKTDTHDRSFCWVSVGSSIKSGGDKLVWWSHVVITIGVVKWQNIIHLYMNRNMKWKIRAKCLLFWIQKSTILL